MVAGLPKEVEVMKKAPLSAAYFFPLSNLNKGGIPQKAGIIPTFLLGFFIL